MSEKLVTVAEFDSPTAAHMVRIRLEEEGIECFIIDNTHLMLAGLGLEGIGAKLQVWESDVDKALQVLKNPTPGDGPDNSK